jgi:hypothetical protein
MLSTITCRRCRHVVRAGGQFCPHCGLEWAREARWVPSAVMASTPPPPGPAKRVGSEWAMVGEYSVGQFHAAKAVLNRYNIPCRVGPGTTDSPNLVMEVPRAAVVWATSLLAAGKR